jgi:hypothetical protein
MASDAQDRHELHQRLAEAIGPDAAGTLMENLPPHPWDKMATKDDLARELAQLETRLSHRIDLVEEHIGSAKNEVIGALRGELIQTVAVQTRMGLIANFASVLTTAAIVIAAVKL